MFGRALQSVFGNRARRIGGMLLSACLLVTMFAGLAPNAMTIRADGEEYALKVAAGTAWGVFGQQVSLVPGKSYEFSYYYSSGAASSVRALVGGQWGATDDAIDASIAYDETLLKKSILFTPPQDVTAVWVGLFSGDAYSEDRYFYNFDLHDKENPEINLLADAKLQENGDSLDKNTWKQKWNMAIDNGFSKVTLASIGGADIFKRTDNDRYALKVAAGTAWGVFGQQVSLVPGKSYEFSYYYSSGAASSAIALVGSQWGATDTAIDASIAHDETLLKTSILFTPPQDVTTVWVGLFSGDAYSEDRYFYNFDLHDKENPEINLLADAKLQENGVSLDKNTWKQKWNGAIDNGFSKVTLASIGGADIFKRTDNDRYALKVAAGTAWGVFGQQVSLIPGKSYEFSYYFSPPGAVSNVMALVGGQSGATDAVIDASIAYDETLFKKSMVFTTPQDVTAVWVGFVSGEAYSEDRYFYGFNLHAKDDPEINLLADANLLGNGDSLDKDTWKKQWNGAIDSGFSKVSIASRGGMQAFLDSFKRTDDTRYVLKLAKNTTGWPWFGQQVALEQGKTYAFSYYYDPKIKDRPMLYKDLQEHDFKPTKKTYDETHCKVTLEFTPPADALTADDGKKLIWVGFRGDTRDEDLYYSGFDLYDVNNPGINLFRDSELLEYGNELNTDTWRTAWGFPVSSGYSKVSLPSFGDVTEYFVRPYTMNTDPKMMYYERTFRGPNQETYGCFTLSFPDELKNTGKNYVFEFNARSLTGPALNEFRAYTVDPSLTLNEDHVIAPVKNEGYTYTFNLRESADLITNEPFRFMIFVPEDSKGHISNIAMYEADENFRKINDKNLLKDIYGDFSHYDKLGESVGLYAKQGGCVGTETGRLDAMPEHYLEPGPDVPVPAGPKMMSYSSVWGAGQLSLDLPCTVANGSANGKNYVVSFYLRPTKGRDPNRYYASGLDGNLVQVYPVAVDGYKYTFHLTERYRFRLSMDIPVSCEGYISRLEMYEADGNFNVIGTENKAVVFGRGGDFSDVLLQAGMSWPGIALTGGFTNTFIDTRALGDELKDGVLGDYHCSGGLWPIPQGYFDASKDDSWAGEQEEQEQTDTGTIQGTLSDQKGSPLSGVILSLVSMQDETATLKAVTNKNGSFEFKDVPLGGYEVYVTEQSGDALVGDDSVWVEEKGDVVTLTLIYDGGGLTVAPGTGEATGGVCIALLALAASVLAGAAVVKKRKGKRIA